MTKGFGLEDYSPICIGKARTERAKEEGQGREDIGKKRGTRKPEEVTEALQTLAQIGH